MPIERLATSFLIGPSNKVNPYAATAAKRTNVQIFEMSEGTSRKCLAARRRENNTLDFDEPIDERKTTRIFNSSFSTIDEPIQTPKQLAELYQKTVELATQGKINVKNAFEISMVERLPQILHVVAFDDEEKGNFGPNFVKVGSVIDTSAKIYGFRVDALHRETQKLSGNFLDDELGKNVDEEEKYEAKKSLRRVKPKMTSFIIDDRSKITLENAFEFRPLQSSKFCQWRGGVGKDSIYAEMISITTYSSSDVPFLDENFREISIENVDFKSLRQSIDSNDEFEHFLGNETLREFIFTENSIDESFSHTFDDEISNFVDSKSDYSFLDVTNAESQNFSHRSIDKTRRIEKKVSRTVRIEILDLKTSIDEIMTSKIEKKKFNSFQSSFVLKKREKTKNQIRNTRKIRPLSELTNLTHFPDFNGEKSDDESMNIDFDNEPMDIEFNDEFVQPIQYEKIEFAKTSTSINAKLLKRKLIEEFENERTNSSILPVEFSILCENLVDHGDLSVENDLPSAFYCLLINCNENKLYMKSNWQCDDLFIQEQPFVQSNNKKLFYSNFTVVV